MVLPPLRMDSQVKYGLLSRGCASIFMRFPPPTYKEKIWDHAAGFVIVEEAGGKVRAALLPCCDSCEGWLQVPIWVLGLPRLTHSHPHPMYKPLPQYASMLRDPPPPPVR